MRRSPSPEFVVTFEPVTMAKRKVMVPPEPVLAAFNKTAHAQRRRPENAMNDAQAALGGGLLTYLIEHVGDLTNRMMKVGYYDIEAGGYEKVAHALHTLRHPGFYREWWENVDNNARSTATPRYEYWARAKNALQRYADEHRKLRVYNQAQFAAREAAVALGELRFVDAVTMLEYLEALTQDGTWQAAVREYRLAPDGSVMEFPS